MSDMCGGDSTIVLMNFGQPLRGGNSLFAFPWVGHPRLNSIDRYAVDFLFGITSMGRTFPPFAGRGCVYVWHHVHGSDTRPKSGCRYAAVGGDLMGD